MRRAAMYGMIGALSLTFGAVVVSPENFTRQNSKPVQESVIPTVVRETDTAVTRAYTCPHTDGNHTPDCPYWDESQTNVCPHTDGNHTLDCPYWDGTCAHMDGNHTPDCPYWDGTCAHTDGNHTPDCPNWTEPQNNSNSNGSSSSNWGNGGHHGGGHHGGGHHGW